MKKEYPVESYRMEILDMSKLPEPKPKPEIFEWEIWIGDYHLGQGHHGPTAPEMVGKVKATSFKIACIIYEHQSQIDSLKARMERGDTYIDDIHLGHWYYKPEYNGNSWTGKYYETKEDAQKSFNR